MTTLAVRNVSRKLATLAAVALLGSALVGCNRLGQNEWGWTPGLTAKERSAAIDANIDAEGKYMLDEIDRLLLLRPVSLMTNWRAE